jgi:hypothetical protein
MYALVSGFAGGGAAVFAAATLCFFTIVASAQTGVTNSVTVREKAGVTTAQYPVQLARPFLPGEVRNFPQAVVNGAPVTTQADVKGRWGDGSVKHAVLTFYLPTLAANGSATVTFANQATGNNTGFLTKAGMLNNKHNFDAVMELSNGAKLTASARSMLNAGAFQYWNQGSVTTSVVIADHGAARAYDVGFDAKKSFRPVFHATFWPAINKVRVRFVGEIANTEALQDQTYALTLKLRSKPSQVVYTKPSFTHTAASRWTKEFWIGGAPPAVEIDHNLAYLKQTKFFPNYDTGRAVSEAAIATAYGDPVWGWAAVPKDLYDAGNLTKYMPTTGGRDEIGPYPAWTVRWLYTGDARMQAQTFGNADLAAAFPVHFREGNGTKPYDRRGNKALGRPLSLVARPTVFLHSGNYYLNYAYTAVADRITPVGPMTDGGWIADAAHQPDYHSPLYTLTGDYFYLEEMYFWAAWGAADTNPGDVYYGRGPTGDTGGIMGEVRADAWLLRARAQAAFLAPDGTPEKAYFTQLTNDALAIWEGTVGLTGTAFHGSANWTWGNTVAVQKYGAHGVPAVPALRFWEEGEPVPAWSGEVDPAMAANHTPPWQHYFLVYALGRAKELGFASDALLSWLAGVVIGQLTDAGYDPYLSASYRMPTVKSADNAYFGAWPDERTGFLASYDPFANFTDQLSDANHGYPIIAVAATAAVAGEPGGDRAWAFMQQQALPAASLNDNPKWAILPR